MRQKAHKKLQLHSEPQVQNEKENKKFGSEFHGLGSAWAHCAWVVDQGAGLGAGGGGATGRMPCGSGLYQGPDLYINIYIIYTIYV